MNKKAAFYAIGLSTLYIGLLPTISIGVVAYIFSLINSKAFSWQEVATELSTLPQNTLTICSACSVIGSIFIFIGLMLSLKIEKEKKVRMIHEKKKVVKKNFDINSNHNINDNASSKTS